MRKRLAAVVFLLDLTLISNRLSYENKKFNELKIGDKLIKCDGNEINDILDIKKVVNINLSIPDRTPFTSRQAPEFAGYFNEIWEDIQ